MELLPVLIIFVVGLAFWRFTKVRRIDDGEVAAVARMYSVPLSPPVIERLRRRLLLVRRWRFVGALTGAAIGVVVAAFTTIELTVNVLLFSIAVGFAVAAVGFELVDARSAKSESGAIATVRPRTLKNVMSFWLLAPCGLTVVLVAGMFVMSVISPPELRQGALVVEPLEPWLLGTLAVLFVAALALAAFSTWLVVHSSERGVDAADVIVRRATRLTAIMTVLGATWMTVGAIGGVLAQPLWNAYDSSRHSILVNGGFLLVVLYVALSALMGFVATVTSLPSRRPRRGGGSIDGQGERSVGQATT